jgi:hypothetical protein
MKTTKTKKTTTIYTNGKSLFTLSNYDRVSGICHANGIMIAKEVTQRVARSMHENGSLFYVQGIGDRKALKNITLKKGLKIENFSIN